MNRLRSFALVVPMLLSGCMLFNGRCIYEIRSLQTAGSVSELGAEIASAQTSLSEQRDSDPNKSLYYAVIGQTLKGHVQSAVLKDAANPTQVLLTLTVADANRAPVSENAVTDRTGTSLNGFFDVLAANRGVIELQTDLPGRSTVIIPLKVVSRTDWMRPYCS